MILHQQWTGRVSSLGVMNHNHLPSCSTSSYEKKRICSTYGRNDKHVQNFNQKTWRKETIYQIWIWMKEYNFKWVLGKDSVVLWSGFGWLSLRSSGRHLWLINGHQDNIVEILYQLSWCMYSDRKSQAPFIPDSIETTSKALSHTEHSLLLRGSPSYTIFLHSMYTKSSLLWSQQPWSSPYPSH